MGATIPQTVYEVFEAGMYRGVLAAAALEDSEFGTQVAVRFDLTEPGFEGKSVRAWASAKLSGGKRPSKLYTWTSALLFSGRPLPEGFDLDIDHLVGRETLVVLDVVQKDGLDRNRVAQLLPLRPAKAAQPAGATMPAAERSILRPRAPLTAAAGIPSGGVPVNALLPVPDEVPEWLNADGDGHAELAF